MGRDLTAGDAQRSLPRQEEGAKKAEIKSWEFIKVPHWRDRLPPAQRHTYDKSAAITAIQLRPSTELRQTTAALPESLKQNNRAQVEVLSQEIVNEICRSLGVPSVKIKVEGVRPSNARGELHGLYTQHDGGRTDTIKVWMRTAKREQVVAFKTFLRTLLHEVCHHLDYTLFHLRDSFHTEGFFQRESSLFYTVVQPSKGKRAAKAEPPSPFPRESTNPFPVRSLSEYVAAYINKQ